MFGFGYRARVKAHAESLGAVLEHVGVHPAELAIVEGVGVLAMPTAENVLLRQAEEVRHLTDMVAVRDAELAEAGRELAASRADAERLQGELAKRTEPLLGLATTRELLAELTARAELNGHADYRTADDERVAPGQEAEGFAVTCERGRAVGEEVETRLRGEELADISHRYRLVNREADAIADALVEFGFPDPRAGVGHDEWFDLKGAVRSALQARNG